MKPRPMRYSASDARKNFAEILRRVEIGNERIAIVRHKKVTAVIVPISVFETLQALAAMPHSGEDDE